MEPLDREFVVHDSQDDSVVARVDRTINQQGVTFIDANAGH
jgi:hypothetical protein